MTEKEKMLIKNLYNALYKNYGAQGWWPLLDIKKKNSESRGYHKREYDWPKTKIQRFEISIGAILTQNTSWKQVEKALDNLDKLKLIDPEKILNAEEKTVKDAIKPAGYFNQKYKKIVIFTKFFIENDDYFNKFSRTKDIKAVFSLREKLLELWGIGKETADSILLYAYNIPIFVIDAYTKRIMSRLGVKFKEYDDLQKKFHSALKPDVEIFQEYHALLVEHAKRYCQKKPKCKDCFLNQSKLCSWFL